MKSFNHVGKFHRHEGERVALLRKRSDSKTRRRAKRNETKRRTARGTFLSPTTTLLLPVSFASLSRSLSSWSYSTSSFLAKSRRVREEAEVDEGRRASSSHRTRERNDSSRRRAVLPRTSHPWFPPALEPLNHSVVQRFEASVVLNASALDDEE